MKLLKHAVDLKPKRTSDLQDRHSSQIKYTYTQDFWYLAANDENTLIEFIITHSMKQ